MKRGLWRQFDFWLFGDVVFLTIFGVMMIRSAVAGSEGLADTVNRQIVFGLIMLGVILAVTLLDYHFWASFSRVLYAITFVLLIFVYLTSTSVFGSARWIQAGLVNIQPSELAKIVVILILADYFARNREQPHDLRWIIQSLLIVGGLAFWIFLQPNLSNTIVCFVLWFALIWLSGLPSKYLIAFVVLAMIIGVIAFPRLEDYQQLRILNFIFPDPNARHGNSYNVDQALVTIGSGGLFGQGYGHASQVQLRFLKVRHTDFIFSAMAAEFGFIGTVIIVGLIVFVILRCLRAARLANDTFGSMIAYGFAILIFLQTAVNIGVNLSLIPVTGLTLPFVSAGGSSLLSLGMGIGLVESVVARHKSLET